MLNSMSYRPRKRKASMSGRELAVRISRTEGKAVNLPIAQIAEVLARLADLAIDEPVGYAQAFARLLARAEKRRRA